MKQALIDTNLLCLLVVGSVAKGLIKNHKRLKIFTENDFDHLIAILSLFPNIVTTPHVLTETSNLLRHSPEPLRSQVSFALSQFVEKVEEREFPAISVIKHPMYHKLGITDCVLMVASQSDAVIISDDLDLCLAAHAAGSLVINYNYFRDGAISLSDIKNQF
ncbi:PIN domain-containing protein [Sphingobium sp.]|uniref:PIN domain-containing protein n=1 Tax=Sphingobium sp. TaxID=1912891 RepID=UPI0025E70031|nr:PIN domain-containing protein [Sphingobium sp.]